MKYGLFSGLAGSNSPYFTATHEGARRCDSITCWYLTNRGLIRGLYGTAPALSEPARPGIQRIALQDHLCRAQARHAPFGDWLGKGDGDRAYAHPRVLCAPARARAGGNASQERYLCLKDQHGARRERLFFAREAREKRADQMLLGCHTRAKAPARADSRRVRVARPQRDASLL